jgi:hypothetical protein
MVGMLVTDPPTGSPERETLESGTRGTAREPTGPLVAESLRPANGALAIEDPSSVQPGRRLRDRREHRRLRLEFQEDEPSA